MKVYIKQPVALHEAGKQKVNEDFIFPLQSQVNTEERLFIVCDGEGGANAGEVASKLVALNIAKYFASNPSKGEIDQEYLDKALASAEKALSNYKETHPESVQMGTTLALLHLGQKQVTLAWVGNSEVIYFDSANQKLITTANPELAEDNQHSLIKGTESPARVSMRFLPNEDIAAGDYFFLATDGIQEHVDHGTLTALLTSGTDPATNPTMLLGEIQNLSGKFNQDNYSCYLIQVEKVAKDVGGATVAGATATPPTEEVPVVEAPLSGKENRLIRTLTFAALLALVACLVGLAAYWSRSQSAYSAYMAQAQAQVSEQNYRAALINYDSAYEAASDATEKSAVIKLQNETLMALRKANTDKFEEPFQNLTESAMVYLERAEANIKEDRFYEAALDYERALRVRTQTQDSLLALPRGRIAYANLMAGIRLYEESPEDRSIATIFLERAEKMYESPDTERQDEESYAMGMQYLNNARLSPNAMDQIASSATNQSPETQSEKSPEDGSGTKSRSLSDLGALNETEKSPAPASTTKSPQTNPSPPATSSPSKPANLSDGSKPASPTATARLSPSGINTRGSDPEELNTLNKYLSEGKRLYVRAKDESSDYLYKLSGENLVRAEKALDGPGAYMLAYMYHMGMGVKKDKATALKYAQNSALKNWPAGHYLYAHLLLERQNSRDTVTARVSLQRAVDLNYPEAFTRLNELNRP